MHLKVVVEKADDGRYYIYVPSLPGVIAEGATQDAALAGLRQTLVDYLEPSDEDLPARREQHLLEVDL